MIRLSFFQKMFQLAKYPQNYRAEIEEGKKEEILSTAESF